MEYFERLKQTREDLDISQTSAAKAIGTTQQQLYKYENGLQEMTVSRLQKLCELYQVSADYILGISKDYRWPR